MLVQDEYLLDSSSGHHAQDVSQSSPYFYCQTIPAISLSNLTGFKVNLLAVNIKIVLLDLTSSIVHFQHGENSEIEVSQSLSQVWSLCVVHLNAA